MPLPYIALHALLTATCFYLALRTPKRWSLPLRLLALGLTLAGFAVERSPEWAWDSMAWGLRDLVFFSNISLEGVTVLLVLTWRDIHASGGKLVYVRGAVLSLLLLGGVVWSYSWFFAPLPAVSGHLNQDGFLLQTSDASCGAAAAVMLLHAYGVESDEKEMAELCLTRAGSGTRPAGIFRGLAVKGASEGLRPQVVTLRPEEFHKLGKPAIIAVGLRPGTPPPIAARMAERGWPPGFRHAVTVFGGTPDGTWLDVGDPQFGRERWPIQDIKPIWDDRALVLVRG